MGARDSSLGPWASACAAAVGLGTSLVASAGDALFLHRVGPEHLGTAFAISSALLVVVLGAVGVRADRGGRERLLLSIGLVGAVGLLAADLMIAAAPTVAAGAILVGGKQVSAAMELAFWVLIAERFDARQIRRAAIGLIAANGAGRAVGAFAVPLAVPAVGTPALIGAGAVAFAVAGMLAPRIASTGALRPLPIASTPARIASLGVVDGAAAVRQSPVARQLFWLVLIGGAFAPVLYYLLGFRASGAFGDEAELAGFLGVFWGVVSVAALISQILVAPRVLARAGVATALAVAPVVAAAGAIAVVIDPVLATVVVAQALVKILDAAVDNPGHRLAQNLTGREVRGRIGGFLDGVAKRVGATVGGVLAALLAAPVLAIIAAVLAAGWTAVALMFRRRFPELAVAELARRAGDPEIGSGESVEALDARSRDRLRRGLIAGGDEASRAVDLVIELDGEVLDAAAELARALAAAPADPEPLRRALASRLDRGARPELTGGVLETLAASDHAGDRMLAARLCDADSALLDRLDGDADPAVVAAVAAARLRGEVARLAESAESAAALRELAALAHGAIDDAVKLPVARALLAPLRRRAVSDPIAAPASALAAMVRDGDAASAEWILFRSGLGDVGARLFDRPGAGPEVRAAALELLAAAGGDDVAALMADQLGHPERPIARAAERGLRLLGSAAIDPLLRTASFGRRRARRPALELLRELRVPESELDALIDREIDQIAQSAARLAGLAALAGGDVLIRRVLERIDESAFTLFTLVEARTGKPAVGAAARRLRYARHRAARARALEALDATLPRRFSPLIGALEPGSFQARARAGAVAAGTEVRDPTEAVRAELGGGDRLARQLAIYAIGDHGRSALRDDITSAARRALEEVDPDELWARLRGSLDPRNGDNDPARKGQRAPEGSSDNEVEEMPRSVESVMVLSQLPLFADLSTRELAELAEVITWVAARPGEVLCAEGEVGEAMYFVLSGEVRVERGGNGAGTTVVATLGPGEPFGEMALFDDEVRSATVIAETASRLGRIDRAAFEEIVGEVPGIALGICRVLSRRVRDGQEGE